MTTEIERLIETITEYRHEPGVEVYIDQLLTALAADLKKPMRYAIVHEDAGKGEQITRYLPDNYTLIGRSPIMASNRVEFLIAGRDHAGWTLDGYVLPRLASGLYYGHEII
jgi:hypothetical protein